MAPAGAIFFWRPVSGRGRHFLPARARLEAGHRPRPRPEVAFVQLAVVADQEAHHARLAPFGRRRDRAEAGNHAAVDHVAVGTARSARALAREDAEVVAPIRLAL